MAATEPNDIVLDPYMGSGTTAVAAKELKRHFLGAEIDKEYWSVARRRLSGEPVDNKFVNLKQLREYVIKHKISDPSKFSFDMQTSKSPSLKKTNLEATLLRKESVWYALSILYGDQATLEDFA